MRHYNGSDVGNRNVIKPAQKLGHKWCCRMCRNPEIKVSVAPDSNVSDVSLFVEELNLPQEAEEMEAVENTVGGVESLDGGFSWEGLYFKSAKSQEENATCEEGFTKGAKGREDNLKDRSSEITHNQGEAQHGKFLSSCGGDGTKRQEIKIWWS